MFVDDCQNKEMTCEQRQGRSSLQASRWVLHDLPSISGCRSERCQPTNEGYHTRPGLVKKTAVLAAEKQKFRPLLRVREAVPKGTLAGLRHAIPTARSSYSANCGFPLRLASFFRGMPLTPRSRVIDGGLPDGDGGKPYGTQRFMAGAAGHRRWVKARVPITRTLRSDTLRAGGRGHHGRNHCPQQRAVVFAL
jgi:hypothetical protein